MPPRPKIKQLWGNLIFRRNKNVDYADLKNLSPTAREHASHPRNNGPIKEFNGHSRITGPCR